MTAVNAAATAAAAVWQARKASTTATVLRLAVFSVDCLPEAG